MPKPFARAVRRSPLCDPQRFRVYRMESESIGARNYMRMSRADIARFARAVCRAYRIRPVKIRYRDLGRWGAQCVEPNILEFGNKAYSRDLITVAHELAHHLHNCIAGDAPQAAHGPEFMGCYLSLFDTARIIPISAMRRVCALHNVAYVDPGDQNAFSSLVRAVTGKGQPRPRAGRSGRR